MSGHTLRSTGERQGIGGSPHRLWESVHASLLTPIGWHCSHQVSQGESFGTITVEDGLDDVRGEVDKFERPANIGLVLSKVKGEVDDRALVLAMLKLLGVLVCGRDGLDQHLVPLDLARRWRDQLRDVPVLAKIARNLVGVWRMFTGLCLLKSGIDEKLLDPAHVELDPDAVRIDDDLAENIVDCRIRARRLAHRRQRHYRWRHRGRGLRRHETVRGRNRKANPVLRRG